MYKCFNLDQFLDAAFNNFQNQAVKYGKSKKFSGVLCLADTPVSIKFRDLLSIANNPSKNNSFQKWQFFRTSENNSLVVKSTNKKRLFIIAGQQIVTKEKLELLAIGAENEFLHDIPIQKLINLVIDSGNIPIIPWGFGKWTGGRGKVINRLLENNLNIDFFLGDNSGRPAILSNSRHFMTALSKNTKILPGSDPLPFESENIKPGAFGFILKGNLKKGIPFNSLREKLSDPLFTFVKYGKNESMHYFVINQIKMQIRKWILNVK